MIDATGAPQRMLLLGGSSELGLAIVHRVLRGRRGEVVLAARPSERRDRAAADLDAAGHRVTVLDFDALRPDEHEQVLEAAFAAGDVDVAVVAFGVLEPQPLLLDDPAAAARLAATNYVGAVSVGVGLARRMRPQGHGHVLALSSVAAERPRRANFVYGSSKAGFDAFFSGLADELHGSGVHVTVLRPGFVRGRMTAGLEPAPFATDPAAVAEAAATALVRRPTTVWVPGPLRWVMVVIRHLPRSIVRRLPR